MRRNAREIELAQWRCLFENGSQGAVLSALSVYQNGDGGFGHALEPDCWNPESSPYTTLFATDILESIGFADMRHPVMEGILHYFEDTEYASEDGWYFQIPSNNDHPRAPWWTWDGKPDAVEGVGLTARIAGFLLKHADTGSELYERALALTVAITRGIDAPGHHGDMGVRGYSILAQSIGEAGLERRFDFTCLKETVMKLMHNSIERDTSKWEQYSVRPSKYIDSPDSIFYRSNEDIVSAELDYLIDTRPEGGVWGIPWSWFENCERYPKEYAVSENWWKAVTAIQNVSFLKNFGRVTS